MNYLTEIKLFYDWLETNPLGSGPISLWHALIQVANRSGWKSPLSVSISTLEARSGLTRSSVYRERKKLKDAGVIDFTLRDGRQSCIYILHSFEMRFAFQYGTQSEIQTSNVFQYEMQSETQANDVFQKGTQIETQNDDVFQNGTLFGTQKHKKEGDVFQCGTECENIYRLNNISISNKENIKRNLEEESKLTAGSDFPLKPPELVQKEKESSVRQKSVAFNSNDWIKTLEPPWQEPMALWLAYKKERRENYKSKMTHDKCLEKLKQLSKHNPQTAQKIVDQSMANNWAGLFELREQHNYSQKQYTSNNGLPIGHVIQPRSEERRRELLESFGN